VSFLKLHILPSLLALLLIWLLYGLDVFPKGQEKSGLTICDDAPHKSAYMNFDTVPSGVLPFLRGLKSPNTVVLLGSSELSSSSDYIPYTFFGQSGDIQVRAFGHAYFQSFSMYCALLSLREFLQGSNICIIVSPGWFETKGTNSQAFVEFVRPEMLANIAHDREISDEYKDYIADYLMRVKSDLSGFTPAMEYFHSRSSAFPLRELRSDILLRQIPSYSYCNDSSNRGLVPSVERSYNWGEMNEFLVKKFDSVCSNDFLVEDGRFSSMTNGTNVFAPKRVSFISIEENQELHDFKILLRMLHEFDAKPSFVIQPLNPYVYDDLASFQDIMKQILAECAHYNFPCLNLYEAEKARYTPGILNDGMHMGDVGWNRVNEFINLTMSHE
jgi:D-alanine transfer protein